MTDDRRHPSVTELGPDDLIEFMRAGSTYDIVGSDLIAQLGDTAESLPLDGGSPMTGNLDMGGNDLDNVGDVAASTLTLDGVLVSVNPVSGTNIAKTYATVADMVAATDLVVGNTAVTQGYSIAGDALAGTYRIVAAGTGTADGHLYIDLTGITGQAELVPSYKDMHDRKVRIRNLFGAAKPDVGVYGAFWNSTVDVEPWLLTHIGAGKYLKIAMRPEGGPGNEPYPYNVDTIGKVDIMMVYQSAGPDTGNITVTKSGTWTNDVASTPAFDGKYAYTNTTGDYYEWTTPDNTTMVGQRGNHLTDGGLCKVEINGDATLATNLPTAQDLVDAGTIASLGTLNATDRILDCSEADDYDYEGMSGNADVAVMFADELPAGTHTVRVTVTGESATAASDTRLYYSAVIYRTEDTTLRSDNVFGMGSNDFNGISNQHGGGLLFIQRVSAETNSVFEFALHPLPSGATDSSHWVGNGHGNEDQTSITYYVDGAAVTPTGQSFHAGDEVTVVRESEFFHPEIGAGATKIADCTVEYRIKNFGFMVTIDIDWLSNGTGEGGWMHMFPLDNSFSMANTVTPYRSSGANVTDDKDLSADDNLRWLDAMSDMIYAWQPTGKFGAAMHITDMWGSNRNFQYVPAGEALYQIQDRVGPSLMNKMYYPRGTNSEPITSGDKWLASAEYLVGIFNPSANAIFAKG